MQLQVEDPLAHRALDALMAAEASVMRELRVELERACISATGFAVLVLLTAAGGSLEMRIVRLRLRTSKANVSEVVDTLEAREFVQRERIPNNRRAVMLSLSESGARMVQQLFPSHTDRVRDAFAPLDEDEKRSFATLCRKLDGRFHARS